jgi:predicted Zn-dependent protease
MKGLILAALVFLGALAFLIITLKNQKGELIKQVSSFKQGVNQAQGLNGGNVNLQGQMSSVSSFAKDPIDSVDNSKYKNFFPDAVSNTGHIYRWNKSNLNYYIDISTQRRITKSKVKRAFDIWEKKSHLFHFNETDNPNNADIAITVATASEKDRMGEAGPDKSVQGKTYTLNGRSITEYIVYHAQVTIASDYFDYKQMSEYQKAGTDYGFQTLVHELGHVLGIMGHSPTEGDCMFFRAHSSGRACDALTPEANTLAMIYGRPDLLTRGFFEEKKL